MPLEVLLDAPSLDEPTERPAADPPIERLIDAPSIERFIDAPSIERLMDEGLVGWLKERSIVERLSRCIMGRSVRLMLSIPKERLMLLCCIDEPRLPPNEEGRFVVPILELISLLLISRRCVELLLPKAGSLRSILEPPKLIRSD